MYKSLPCSFQYPRSTCYHAACEQHVVALKCIAMSTGHFLSKYSKLIVVREVVATRDVVLFYAL